MCSSHGPAVFFRVLKQVPKIQETVWYKNGLNSQNELEKGITKWNSNFGQNWSVTFTCRMKKHEYCAHISKMVTFVGNLFCRDKGGPKTCCTKSDNWITMSERYQGTPMRQCPSFLRGHTSRMKAISYFHKLFFQSSKQSKHNTVSKTDWSFLFWCLVSSIMKLFLEREFLFFHYNKVSEKLIDLFNLEVKLGEKWYMTLQQRLQH